ncbi:MAG: T9SS type A sorting domain-containing protein [Bacteroidia bacterium]|jgi:hypothetical protein|nr:T9SS type A sorting domain-containing protein [Bacteroidia bacterium]
MNKQLLVLLLIVLVPSFATSQNYRPLPGAGASWQLVTYSYYSQTYNTQDYYYLEVPLVNSDTSIQTNVYHRLIEHSLFYPTGNYLGGFRSDSTGKTWWLPSADTTEFLLMDLNVNQGDTVRNVYSIDQTGLPATHDFYVDSTGIMVTGSLPRKTVYVRSVPSGMNINMWIEGLGAFNGFLNKTYSAGPLYRFDNFLCISYEDTVWYTGDSLTPNPHYFSYYPDSIQTMPGSCALYVLSLVGQEEQLPAELCIYPNPATYAFILEPSTNQLSTLRIFSLSAQLLHTQRIQGRTEIDVSTFPEGIYLLELETPQGIVRQKLVLQR